ncbi:MAG: tetratricopeptide repeat protein [Spirochaetota bacterium]|nr:tetratricopeptide repeat protein [Spirochaetota bacterium]
MWLFSKRKKQEIEKDSIVSELWEFDFCSGGENRFELEDSETLCAEIKEESLVLTAKKSDLFIWSLNNFYRYNNFILDAEISIEKNNGHSAAGFLFRYADENNYYYLMISENGFFRLDVVFNGSPRILIPWTSCKIKSLQDIKVKIIVHGLTVTLFIDDIWIGEIDDESIDAGYIAFGGQNFSDKLKAVFGLSKIRIESRAIKVELEFQSQVKNGSIPVENRKELATRFFESGQYSAVLIQIKKALRNNTRNYELSFLMAKSLSRLAFHNEALKALDSCIDLSGSINKDIIIEKASVLYKLNRLVELRDFLNLNLDILLKTPFLLNLRANTEDGLGKFDTAIDFYKQAIDLESENGVFRINLARTLEKSGNIELAFRSYSEAALCFFRDENFIELSQILSNMSRLKPGNKEGLILEGKILFQEGRLGEAYLVFHKLRNGGLKDSSVDFLYGIILRDKGQQEEALSLFESSALSEPDYYPYWFKYAETLYLMGLPAEDIVIKAIALEKDNPWGHNLYGLILLSENRASDAKLSFAKALELEKDSIDLLINYSNAVSEVDGTEAAISLFPDQSTSLKMSSVQNQIGNLYYDQGEYNKASDYYKKAVREDGSNRTYKENLSSALIKQDYILAAEEILSGLMAECLTPATLEMTAQVAFRKGEYKRAETSFLEAIKLEPENSRILLNYGDFLFTRLNYSAVEKIAEKVIVMSKKRRVKSADIENAEILLKKVKTVLNSRYECSICGTEWWVPNNIPIIDVVRLHGEPDGDSPAGKCNSCGKVYCVKCAVNNIKNSRFVCPDCDEYLKLSENYLKYLAMEYVKKADK